ncbi:uncharacterized protein LOC124652101 [Lolium rigidum]|uniref:uncharacterized protein LOC124652101 n=1 Tax=Lolium rigidum TaxID=89674 RepID=UPI001F5CB235|nr:uncharacterized protein LOC124652101 [Lolium rigidum]
MAIALGAMARKNPSPHLLIAPLPFSGHFRAVPQPAEVSPPAPPPLHYTTTILSLERQRSGEIRGELPAAGEVLGGFAHVRPGLRGAAGRQRSSGERRASGRLRSCNGNEYLQLWE